MQFKSICFVILCLIFISTKSSGFTEGIHYQKIDLPNNFDSLFDMQILPNKIKVIQLFTLTDPSYFEIQSLLYTKISSSKKWKKKFKNVDFIPLHSLRSSDLNHLGAKIDLSTFYIYNVLHQLRQTEDYLFSYSDDQWIFIQATLSKYLSSIQYDDSSKDFYSIVYEYFENNYGIYAPLTVVFQQAWLEESIFQEFKNFHLIYQQTLALCKHIALISLPIFLVLTVNGTFIIEASVFMNEKYDQWKKQMISVLFHIVKNNTKKHVN